MSVVLNLIELICEKIMGILDRDFSLLEKSSRERLGLGHTLTLGRLNNRLSEGYKRELKSRGDLTDDLVNEVYIDKILTSCLGAIEVSSVDISPYQGCSVVHDLNEPVAEREYNKFDTIIDGGTLEHIFHFPMAMENIMKMLKVNGEALLFTMANNHCGHGFYQFSPELFYRLFDNRSFDILEMYLAPSLFPGQEIYQGRTVYEVKDPAAYGARISLQSFFPFGLMVRVRKVESFEGFGKIVQSDYLKKSSKEYSPAQQLSSSSVIRDILRGVRQTLRSSIFNQRAYKKIRL